MKNKGDEPSRRMMTKKIKNVMFPNNPVNEAKPQQLPQPNPKKKKTCAFIDSRNFMDSNNRSSSRRASIFFGSHKATQIIRNKKWLSIITSAKVDRLRFLGNRLSYMEGILMMGITNPILDSWVYPPKTRTKKWEFRLVKCARGDSKTVECLLDLSTYEPRKKTSGLPFHYTDTGCSWISGLS